MLRTQIYLPANQLRLLKKIAWERESSLSEVLRRLIEEKLEEDRNINVPKNTGSWLLSLAKKAEKLKIKAPKDLASNMDKYLYGSK